MSYDLLIMVGVVLWNDTKTEENGKHVLTTKTLLERNIPPPVPPCTKLKKTMK